MRYTSMGLPSNVGTIGMVLVHFHVDHWYYPVRAATAGPLGYAFR